MLYKRRKIKQGWSFQPDISLCWRRQNLSHEYRQDAILGMPHQSPRKKQAQCIPSLARIEALQNRHPFDKQLCSSQADLARQLSGGHID
jgi:hypothetical protein